MEDIQLFLSDLLEKYGLLWQPSQAIDIYNEITTSLTPEQQIRMAVFLAVTSYCDPKDQIQPEPLILRVE